MKKSFLIIHLVLYALFQGGFSQPVFYGMTSGGGKGAGGVLFKFNTTGNALNVEYSWNQEGRNPSNSLTLASDGKFYGMTTHGGAEDYGTMFSLDPVTGTYSKIKDFLNRSDGANPSGSLVQASDGKLYGTTAQGGESLHGTIFSFNPVTGIFSKLKDFKGGDGSSPQGNLVVASDGKLYGMTASSGRGYLGTIFSFDPVTGIHRKLKDFEEVDGAFPYGSLVLASNGKLYGMTNSAIGSWGTIFSLDPVSGVYKKLKDFTESDGAYPYGSLVVASNGKLYGMTPQGGSNNYGTIFSFDPDTETLSKLKDFTGNDGASPNGSMVVATNGKLYGMTSSGGAEGYGTIFSFDPATGTHKKLKDFSYTDGANPQRELAAASDGKFYGMTFSGGAGGYGMIFSFDPVTGIIDKLKGFEVRDGAYPEGNLIAQSNGKLFGMTKSGGSNFRGTIFSFDRTTGTHSKLKDFANIDGVRPTGNFVAATNGQFFGVTQGGSNGFGVLFSFDPVTETYVKLKLFAGSDGAYPFGSLVEASNGKLYGMTNGGGVNSFGTIFSFDPVTGTHNKLKDFAFGDGAFPFGSLVMTNGKLYGMTSSGGDKLNGTIFSFDPVTGAHIKLKDFAGSDGAKPRGSLVEFNGKLYGMTTFGGAEDYGTLFSFDPITETYNKLKDFRRSDGANPYGSLVAASDGKLYGMTTQGGTSDYGTIFSFDPIAEIFSKLQDFEGHNGRYPYGDLIEVVNCTAATEVCDGVDNDCDGLIDEGLKLTYYPDADGDGFGKTSGAVQACTAPPGFVTNNSDCNDNSAAVKPGAVEICDGLDNDCDGQIDEGVKLNFYPDADGDGYGKSTDAIQGCTVPAGYVNNNNDCNDNDATVNTARVEVCGNGIDDDCDGVVDEGCIAGSNPNLSVSERINIEGNSGTNEIVFIITLSKISTVPVTVNYQTANHTATAPQDFIQISGSVTFPAYTLIQTVSVSVNGDLEYEGNEKFKLVLSSPVNGTLKNSEAFATIIDDDPDPLTVQFSVQAMPNPSSSFFKLNITAKAIGNIEIRAVDISGRKIEERKLAPGSQQVSLGEAWLSGVYIVEVTQGEERRLVKLVKLK